MRKYTLRVTTIIAVSVGIVLTLLTIFQVWQADADSEAPALAFLGEGGSYSVGDGYNFIVKQTGGFRFIAMPGPQYTAQDRERVWSVLGNVDAPRPDHNVTRVVGPVQKDCVIEFATIDDDEDDRINYFKLDGMVIYTMAQGMTARGRFVIPFDGVLSYEAQDSIGMFLSVCEQQVTPTPTATLTPTLTATPTITPTGTIVPTETPLPSPSPTPQVDLVRSTPTPVIEADKDPRLPACLRINFDISGHEAKAGMYVAQEVGGRVLAGWQADNGWKDSGWFHDIDITFPAVYVDVLYYEGPDAEPVRLKMYNPAPDSEAGWVARGMCHALEVGW
jgi:hypothetical protein